MIELKLPTWLNGSVITDFKNAVVNWWNKVESWVNWPLTQMDAETCTMGVLDLLAWQRDIERFNSEPEWLYRKRVKFAVANSIDAGSTAGIKRIFNRLGVGFIEVEERLPDRDQILYWDVVQLHLSNSQLSDNPQLLPVLLEMYGRTCRRYEFVTLTSLVLELRVETFDDDHATIYAK